MRYIQTNKRILKRFNQKHANLICFNAIKRCCVTVNNVCNNIDQKYTDQMILFKQHIRRTWAVVWKPRAEFHTLHFAFGISSVILIVVVNIVYENKTKVNTLKNMLMCRCVRISLNITNK